MKRAVCLVSGGLDSCVSLACAVDKRFSPAALHVHYGQRTSRQERRAFDAIADYYRLDDRLVCDLSDLGRMGGSALTDISIPLPDGRLDRDEIPDSYVPFRNASLLATGVSWAEVIGARAVFIGAVEEDSSGYPDCREEFFSAFQRSITLGTRPESRIEIHTPLIHLTKADIVRLGTQLKAPLHLTWSCYRDETTPCLRCDSCLLRQRGFEAAGFDDPALGA